MLYGISPLQASTGADLNLKPVMSLKSRIIAINAINKGDAVGYGSTWIAEQDSLIAVVGIGYGDGYPRHVRQQTPVSINGKLYSIVGRVSMDMICVLLDPQSKCRIGDEVVLWGEELPIETIAEKAGTIPYEICCQVTGRVRFIETENE